MSKKKVKLTYTQVVEMQQAHIAIGTMKFKDAPLDFLIEISENQVMLQDHGKVLDSTRYKLLDQYAEKGKMERK